MAFSQEEQQLIIKLKSEGRSTDEIASAVGGMRMNAPSKFYEMKTPDQISKESLKGTGRISETVGDIGETLKGVLSTWGTAGENIHTRITGGTVNENDTAYNPKSLGSALVTGVEVGGDIMRGIGRTFDQLTLGAGKIALSQQQEDTVKNALSDVATSVLETGTAQNVISAYKGLDPQTKNTLDTVGAYVEGLLELVPAITAHKFFNHVKDGSLSLKQLDDVVSFVDDVSDVTQPSTTGKLLNKIDDVVPEGTAVREIGEEATSRVKRGIDDFADTIANKKALAEELADATPEFKEARRVGWTPQQLSNVTEADDVTREGFKRIQFVSEGGPSIARAQKASDIAGDAMEDIYGTIEAHRKSVGAEIGKAIDNLPDTTVNMQPAYNQIDDLLEQNGIIIRNGRFIDAPNYTDAQARVIKEAYSKFKGDEIMDAVTVHAKDRTFGQLQREAYTLLDKQPVMVTTPRGDMDLIEVMRDVYRSPLDDLSPEMRSLNKSYALTRSASDDISNTVRKEMKNLGVQLDQGAKTGSLLRRIDSRAVSSEDFRAVATASYIRARALGYKGADPVALIQFTDDIAPLYATPSAVPPTGFIGSIKGALGKVVEAGAPSEMNKARAMSKLIDAMDDVKPQTVAEAVTVASRAKTNIVDGLTTAGAPESIINKIDNIDVSGIDNYKDLEKAVTSAVGKKAVQTTDIKNHLKSAEQVYQAQAQSAVKNVPVSSTESISQRAKDWYKRNLGDEGGYISFGGGASLTADEAGLLTRVVAQLESGKPMSKALQKQFEEWAKKAGFKLRPLPPKAMAGELKGILKRTGRA